MPNLFDNLSAETQLAPALRLTFDEFDHLDIATGYLDLRGWSAIADQIDRRAQQGDALPVARVLVGMVARSDAQELLSHLQDEVQRPAYGENLHDYDKAQKQRERLVAHLRVQLSRGLATSAGQVTLRKLRRQLADGLVEMKVFTTQPLHGKTYIFSSSSRAIGNQWSYLGSSNLTGAGLTSNLELNIDVVDGDANTKLASWFSKHWEDRFSLPIDAEVIDLIEESWASEKLPTPFEIYLKVCHSLSEDARAGSGYVLPPKLDRILLGYQQDAVRTLARRIVRRGGTMLGDVVGLGKTLTAIGTAAMLQGAEDFTTLVLCPKNLEQMWKDELDRFDITSHVVPYSMAPKDLPDLKRYHLVICDESHNLRNNATQAYTAIHQYIRGNDSKVLLLTATPYNLAFADVANQLGLFIDEDTDLGIVPSAAIRADPTLSDKVDGKINTLVAFRRSEEAEDWKRLMSEHLIRRTRSFIMRSSLADESKLDKEGNPRRYMEFPNGERFYFPERIARPVAHHFDATDPARLMEDDVTLDAIRSLHLARYRLADYDDPKAVHTAQDNEILDDIRSGRGNVSGFVRVGLFKRLSSSGHSFILSLTKQRTRNELLLHCIANRLPFPLGSVTENQMRSDRQSADEDIEVEVVMSESPQERYEALTKSLPPSTRWINAQVFSRQLSGDLAADNDVISALLSNFGAWSPDRDSKLKALIELLSGAHAGEKVLVFTEYRDTAEYIAESLAESGVGNIGLATGSSPDPASIARRFSPQSNRLLASGAKDDKNPIDVLVATDVLSEGQNLQDSHVVVNYDLPWAIIRVIQRAGRVDRVGQQSDTVYIYLITHDNIERQINLRQRIKQRLGDAAQAFGSDEKFFGTDEEVQALGDLYDGRVNDETSEEDDEADAVSEAFLVWSNAQIEHPDVAARVLKLPDLVHSARPAALHDKGDEVVCFISTTSGVDAFALSSPDRIESLLTPTEALRIFRATLDTPTEPTAHDFYERQRDLVHGPLTQETVASGNLKGIRKWTWERLSGNLLVAAAVTTALDALHQRPLTEHATHQLSRARRQRYDDGEIAELISQLHEEDRLVIRASDNDDIRVVCSLGVNQR